MRTTIPQARLQKVKALQKAATNNRVRKTRLALAVVGTTLTVAGGCEGHEVVHFRNGFCIQADSHVTHDRTVEVKVGAGTMEFSLDQVESIEVTASKPLAVTAIVEAPGIPAPEVLLADAAVAQGIDAAFMRSVAKIESGFRQAAQSQRGAIGLMQLMPGTARELMVDPTHSDENARGGAMYLRKLLLQYRGDSALALAAYNAGPGAVRKYRGIPPYLETQRYVRLVLSEYRRQLQSRTAAPKQNAGAAKTPSKTSATD